MNKPVLPMAALSIIFAFSSAFATAESITYTYIGTGFTTGTNFTYTDPDGFLTFDTGKLVPNTATHLLFKGIDDGQIVAVEFVDAQTLSLYTPSGYQQYPGFNLNTFGMQQSNYANFYIAPTSGVSEPSSLVLLATGALGVATSLRRKFLRSGSLQADAEMR